VRGIPGFYQGIGGSENRERFNREMGADCPLGDLGGLEMGSIAARGVEMKRMEKG